MTKLKNIGYLRFGSKIRQGFAVATPSLIPRLFFFPLWMLFAANAGVGGGLSFYIGGGSLPPPCRAVGLPAAPPSSGRGLAPPSGGRGLAPPSGGRGLHAIKLKFYPNRSSRAQPSPRLSLRLVSTRLVSSSPTQPQPANLVPQKQKQL